MIEALIRLARGRRALDAVSVRHGDGVSPGVLHMVKLTELEPEWLRVVMEGRWREVPMAEAQGLLFLCPKCFVANGGAVGTHSVICWSRSAGVSDDEPPKPGRWTWHGTGFEDLTLESDPPGGSRSVLLTGGCGWHGFITNGEVTI